MANRYYITTPIYYVNDVPHLGTYYTTVAADILARFHRLRGEEVLFATGTDENAPKVAKAATDRGKSPQEFVDDLAGRFEQAWRDLGISHDVFIRTTEERHVRAVQHFFQAVCDKGDIYKGVYEGWYCLSDETYFSDEEVVLEGDQVLCPNAECHRPLERVREENYFFALSRYGERLREYIDSHPDLLLPEFRKNEVLRFIDAGLRDVCISRSRTDWGIPVPGDPSQVIYVWYDALINYITITGYPDDAEQMAQWWPANLHLVGKDIYVRFHCTLWPAMLMAAGLEPPRQVFGHGFWMIEHQKMSKSRGNVIHPVELSDSLTEWTGARREIAIDAVRYFLFREVPFGQDGDFSRNSLVQRFNAELANDLGNSLNRTISLTQQNFSGTVPPAQGGDRALADLARELHPRIDAALERLDLQGALTAIWEYVGALNRYINEREPWAMARQKQMEALGTVLYNCLEALRVLSTWVAPFMSSVAAEMQRQLGIQETPPRWQQCELWGYLQTGAAVAAPVPIFPKFDPDKILNNYLKKMNEPSEQPNSTAAADTPAAAATAPAAEPAAETTNIIGIEDFAKVELRVAEVLAADRVPKADKLLQIRVSLGDEERTVLAGLAEYYQPEDLVGRRVILVANLAPRKMRGVESQGMLLAAESGDTVALLQPDKDLPPGAKVR